MIRQKLCCAKCGYFLALEDQDKYLSIKYRDLYIAFEGGILKVICPSCGTQNIICTDEYKELHPEEYKDWTASPDVTLVKYEKWISRKSFVNKKE